MQILTLSLTQIVAQKKCFLDHEKLIICFADTRASRKYRQILLTYQYFSASVQFILIFPKLKLQTSKDCKIFQNKNVSYQRVLLMCKTKSSLD